MSDLGVRLVKGARSFNLNEADKCLTRRDFVPPATIETPLIAAGNARSDGRGVRISTKPSTRGWSFSVRLLGTSGAEVQGRARSLLGLLAEAGDESEPLYVEVRTSTDVPVPLWGQQGAARLYEVLSGALELSDDYAWGARRKRAISATLRLTIQPYAIGSQQRLCASTGGIVEDTIGSADGRSKGLIVPEATTNKMTNPVFGHATWNNGWTKGSSLLEAQNTDEEYLIPGTANSARLTSAAAANNTYTQSINAGNTNAHSLACYARLVDGGAISSTQVQLYYNTALTTTFTALGNGWYRLTATNFSGINAGTPTGVVVKNGYAIYVTGFQLEEKAYCTPMGWGDNLGWAWSGTAHGSTSARTAAFCALTIASDTLLVGGGAVRIVWRTPVSNTHPNDLYLFSSGAAAILAYFKASDDKFYLTDGSNTISTAAQTFSAGDVIVLHLVWGAGQLAIYKNGVSAASGATFTPPALGTALYLGTTAAGGSNSLATFTAATFDHALSQTEVTADYNDVAPVATAGRRVESVPWLWTDDGDNILSLDTGKKPIGVAGGVPGSATAITEIQGSLSSNWATIKSIVLSNYAVDEPLSLADLLLDQSDVAAGGDYGGQHRTTNVNGTDFVVALGTISARGVNLLKGGRIYLFARMFGDTATSINIYASWVYQAATYNSALKTIALPSGSAYRMFYTPGVSISLEGSRFTGNVGTTSTMYLYASKISTTVNVSVDYVAILPGSVLIASLAGGAAVTQWAYKGYNLFQGAGGNNLRMTVTGDVIELSPEKLNHLQCYFCAGGADDPVTTYQNTISAIYVNPRWALV